jgi:hypothetical protein
VEASPTTRLELARTKVSASAIFFIGYHSYWLIRKRLRVTFQKEGSAKSDAEPTEEI